MGDLNATMRCSALNVEGSVAERRYRLVRFQLRRQLQANFSWEASDTAPVPRPSSTAELEIVPAVPVDMTVPSVVSNVPAPPISSQVSLSFNLQVTFSGARSRSVPTTTTSATIPTFSEARYTNVLNHRLAVNNPLITFGDFSVLRNDTFATGTPTQPGYVPPYSEPFSFIGHHSLINTTRAANSTIRDYAAVSSAGEQWVINSPLDVPVTSMSHGLSESRLPSLPNVPNEASMRRIPSLPLVPLNLGPQYEPSSYTNHNAGFNSSRLPSSTFHAGEIVRKWNLQFDGRRGHSAEEFLLRVNECRSGTRLSELNLLDTLPHLLTGRALQWHRLERRRWAGWTQFVVAFRRRFGGVNFQLRVREEVRRRTQGPDEAIADYLVGLRHIMNYVSPPYSTEEQIDFAYANLHPNYRSRIERDQLNSLGELEAKGEQLEAARLLSREYRSSLSPRVSLFPEHAYSGTATKASSGSGC